jgi:hypothetical protein
MGEASWRRDYCILTNGCKENRPDPNPFALYQPDTCKGVLMLSVFRDLSISALR